MGNPTNTEGGLVSLFKANNLLRATFSGKVKVFKMDSWGRRCTAHFLDKFSEVHAIHATCSNLIYILLICPASGHTVYLYAHLSMQDSMLTGSWLFSSKVYVTPPTLLWGQHFSEPPGSPEIKNDRGAYFYSKPLPKNFKN